MVDVGCGTGQLAIPLARHVRTVVGLDPVGDMLARARAAAAAEAVQNICWMLGSDADVPTLRTLLGEGSAGAACIEQPALDGPRDTVPGAPPPCAYWWRRAITTSANASVSLTRPMSRDTDDLSLRRGQLTGAEAVRFCPPRSQRAMALRSDCSARKTAVVSGTSHVLV
ncbi:MAG: hypothetical protein QOG62_2824 [Thermoleophilaceae bacterium]|nr:hypothetical protein [Thermoleophilaceae bacterium]